MRKPVLILITILLLQACSGLDFLPATSGPVSINTPTPSLTPTNRPTRTPLPTFTATPKPRDTATLIIAAINTPVILADEILATLSVYTPTPFTPTGGFESISLSEGEIYYGACKQNYTKMTVKVEHPEDVRKVYLFFRLETAKKSGKTTPWSGTVTDNDGAGFFIYTLRANNIPERKNFIKAWVHYQFVSVNAEKEIIGRTQIYTRNIVLEPCK